MIKAIKILSGIVLLIWFKDTHMTELETKPRNQTSRFRKCIFILESIYQKQSLRRKRYII